MNQTKATQFVNERGKELRSLARVLSQVGVIRDPEPLNSAAGNCRGFRSGSAFRWGYDVHELAFRQMESKDDGLRHSRPSNVKTAAVRLTVALVGECLDGDLPVDPLCSLAVDLHIDGTTDDDRPLTCAWHFDRHILDPAQTSTSVPVEGESDFAHPHYHFQFGGRYVWDKPNAHFGTHLLMEPPRIAHPPLDAVLAVDFVLSNYYPEEWRRLRQDSGPYNLLLRVSQDRLWKPYAVSTAQYWQRPPQPAWAAQLIWPQLFDHEVLSPAV